MFEAWQDDTGIPSVGGTVFGTWLHKVFAVRSEQDIPWLQCHNSTHLSVVARLRSLCEFNNVQSGKKKSNVEYQFGSGTRAYSWKDDRRKHTERWVGRTAELPPGDHMDGHSWEDSWEFGQPDCQNTQRLQIVVDFLSYWDISSGCAAAKPKDYEWAPKRP